jgi:hypothetical protein
MSDKIGPVLDKFLTVIEPAFNSDFKLTRLVQPTEERAVYLIDGTLYL